MFFAFIFESVGGTEWLVLLGVILIVVGPKNLPSAARTLGSIMSKLRRAADEFKRQLMSMDEEIRKGVDEAMNTDYVETPKDDPSKTPDDASASQGDGADRAETDYYGSAYDEGNPYPGHEYYDETQYQEGSDAAATESASAAEAPVAAPAEPEKPKTDPYEIKITVSTAADKKGRA